MDTPSWWLFVTAAPGKLYRTQAGSGPSSCLSHPHSSEATALTGSTGPSPVISSWPHLSPCPSSPPVQPPGPFPASQTCRGAAAFEGCCSFCLECPSPGFPSSPVVFAQIHLLCEASPDPSPLLKLHLLRTSLLPYSLFLHESITVQNIMNFT